jgi:predicted O-methyltransferase YrrM
MTNIAAPDLQATIQAWDQAAWSLAALVLAARGDGPPEFTAAAGELLAATGLTAGPRGRLRELGTSTPGRSPGRGRPAPGLRAGQRPRLSLGRPERRDTASTEERKRAGSGALLPMMGDLAGRLAAPGARMLDVGTGVATAAVGFAQPFPQLHVQGIDILDRALDLARQAIAASDVAARVTVRKQDVADFADDAGFDVAWIPAPFIAQPALRSGLPRVAAALRPGGWLITGHGKLGAPRSRTPSPGSRRSPAAAHCWTKRRHAACSATPGLTMVRPVPTPPGAPAITIGQKPA